MHWADKMAQDVIEACKKRGLDVATCRSGQSPSGAKHIGAAVDNIRSVFVMKTVRANDFPARHIQTHDDMDPLRKPPSKIYDYDGNLKPLTPDQKNVLEKHVGVPYVHVPDPFGCCESWAKHFGGLLERGFGMLGLDTRYDSSHDYLHQGLYNPYIEKAIGKLDQLRKIMAQHQKRKDFSKWWPFDVICSNCGKLTGITASMDIETKTAKYVCDTRVLANEYEAAGCGHKGEASWKEGKLPWRLEWPAQWDIVKTVFEPVGKEHQEGSWPSGVEISEKIYGTKPPIPLFNEFFLLEGKKMATRYGNVYIIQELMKVIEPAPFLYLYAKNPGKARDISLVHLERMTDEYEHAEKVFFGTENEQNEREAESIKRSYELSTRVVPAKYIQNVPYTVCATVAQLTDKRETAIEMLKGLGHLKDATRDEEEIAWKRVQLANSWASSYASEDVKILVNEKVPEDVKNKLSVGQKKALQLIAKELERPRKWTADELQQRIYEMKDDAGIGAKELFAALYMALINRQTGPRAGLLVTALGIERVRKTLVTV